MKAKYLADARTGLFGQCYPYSAFEALDWSPGALWFVLNGGGKAIAFSCLTRGMIGFVLTELMLSELLWRLVVGFVLGICIFGTYWGIFGGRLREVEGEIGGRPRKP